MQIEIFSKVKDPRDLGKVKHELEDVLRMALIGVLCDCEDCDDISDMVTDREEEFKAAGLLKLTNGVPCGDTILRVVESVNPSQLRASLDCCRGHIMESLCGHQVIIDGKKLRGENPKSLGCHGVYILNAWVSETEICVAEKPVDDNRQLLQQVDASPRPHRRLSPPPQGRDSPSPREIGLLTFSRLRPRTPPISANYRSDKRPNFYHFSQFTNLHGLTSRRSSGIDKSFSPEKPLASQTIFLPLHHHKQQTTKRIMVQRKNGFLIFAWGMSLLAWVFKQDSLALGVEFLVMTGIVLIAIFLSIYRHNWNYLAVIKSAYSDPLLNFGTFIVIVLIPFYGLIPETARPAIAFLSSSCCILALSLPYLLKEFPPYTLKHRD